MDKKTYSLILSILLSAFALFAISAQEGFAQSYTLTVINTGAGHGTVKSNPSGINCGSICTGTFAKGKKVTLKAKPDNDSSFAGWAGGGCTGINPSCSVIMDEDKTVTATFDLKTPEISLSTDRLEFDLGSKKKVSQTLGISNIGTGNLIVTASVEGADFSIKGKSTFVVKPNKSYNLKVTYAPSASGTLEADMLATHEPTSGDRESEVEASSESGDIEPSAEGSDDQSKLKLDTNDPQNLEVLVELTPLVLPQPKSAFIKVPTWQLDITWSANDAYEDSDYSAKVEMTTTATFILKQTDKGADYGIWGAKSADDLQSWNMSYSGFYVRKQHNERMDFSPALGQPVLGVGAAFLIGGVNNRSGYEVAAMVLFPLNITPGGTTEAGVALGIEDPTSPDSMWRGPLPMNGLTIHGSLVIPWSVPPFGLGGIPETTMVGIQYVLKPYSGK